MRTARLILILKLVLATLWQTAVPCCAGLMPGRQASQCDELVCPCECAAAARSGCGCHVRPIEDEPTDDSDDRTCPYCKGEVSPARAESTGKELRDDGSAFPMDGGLDGGPRWTSRDGSPAAGRVAWRSLTTRGARIVPLRI